MTIADLTRFFGQSAELFRLGPRSLRYIAMRSSSISVP